MSETAQAGYVALAVQTAKGSPATLVAGDAMRVTAANVSGQSELLDNEAEIGGGLDVDSSAGVLGGFSVSGDLEGQLRPKLFGRLLIGAGFAAAAPVQDATTGAWTHTFTPAATPKYLTIGSRWGSVLPRLFTDCQVGELSLSLDANGKVTWSASIVGRNEDLSWAGIVPTFETSPVANYAGSAVTLDELGTYKFEQVGVSIGRNLSDDEFVIGSRLLDDLTAGQREVMLSGRIKVGANDPSVTDLYRAAVFGSKMADTPGGSDPYHTSAEVAFASSRLIGTSVSKRFGAFVTLPDVVLAGFPLEASGEDRLAVEIEGRAMKGAGNVVTIELQNDQSTAY